MGRADKLELLITVLGAGAVKMAAVQTTRGPRIRLMILGEGGLERASIDLQEEAAEQVKAGLDAMTKGMRLGTALAHDDET